MDREQHPTGGHRELELDPGDGEGPLDLAPAPDPPRPSPTTSLESAEPPPQLAADAVATTPAAALELQRFPGRSREQLARQRAPIERQVAERRARLPVAPATSVRVDLKLSRWLYLGLGLLLLGGASYTYCRYRVHQQQHLFFSGNQPLRDLVMKSRARPRVEDVRRIVLELGSAAGLALVPGDIEVIVEPIDTARHADKLEPDELMRAQAFGASWIVGHRTQGTARFGFVAERFTLERFFYLHEFDAPPGASRPRPITAETTTED